jgi:hypothetical protein
MGEDTQQSETDGKEPPIPGNAFAAVGVAGARGSQSLYPKSIAVDRLIMKSVRTLGVTRYQLAKLLGCSNPNMIYGWLSGTRRPSPLFLSRLNWMLLLRADGMNWVKAKTVDWEAGTIVWRTDNRGRKVHYDANGDLTFVDETRKAAERAEGLNSERLKDRTVGQVLGVSPAS